jgi:hypothetical protein
MKLHAVSVVTIYNITAPINYVSNKLVAIFNLDILIGLYLLVSQLEILIPS